MAELATYPGYTSDSISPAGVVMVDFFDDGTLAMSWDMTGLAPNCDNCGIHIHAGISCDTHEEVKGHYWNDEVQPKDPWVTSDRAVYFTRESGTSSGMFYTFSGYTFEENVGHAVVVHDEEGIRIGCGLLKL